MLICTYFSNNLSIYSRTSKEVPLDTFCGPGLIISPWPRQLPKQSVNATRVAGRDHWAERGITGLYREQQYLVSWMRAFSATWTVMVLVLCQECEGNAAVQGDEGLKEREAKTLTQSFMGISDSLLSCKSQTVTNLQHLHIPKGS